MTLFNDAISALKISIHFDFSVLFFLGKLEISLFLFFFKKLKLPLIWNHKKNLLIVLLITIFEKNIKLTIFFPKKELLKWIYQLVNPYFST